MDEEVGQVNLPYLARDEHVALRQPCRRRDNLTRNVREHLGFAGRLRLVLQREHRLGQRCGEEKGLSGRGKLVDEEGEFGREGGGEEAVGFVEDLRTGAQG